MFRKKAYFPAEAGIEEHPREGYRIPLEVMGNLTDHKERRGGKKKEGREGGRKVGRKEGRREGRK